MAAKIIVCLIGTIISPKRILFFVALFQEIVVSFAWIREETGKSLIIPRASSLVKSHFDKNNFDYQKPFMFTVALSGLTFYAPIGFYKEERLLHNQIEITVRLSRPEIQEAEQLLNYETVYQIIKEEVAKEEIYLEGLLLRLKDRLKGYFPEARLFIEIKKLHPPFGGKVAHACVQWED